VPKLHLIRGKRVKSLLPLFNCYVFLFSSEEERIGALKTNRVVQMLPVSDQELLLNDLRQIQRLIASNAPLTIEQRLMPGRRVRIKSGLLRGLEGTILDRCNNSRLLVAVNFLQKGVSLDIEDFMVEPID
jgi:transcriptional antiterminator RfaH